ncbi:MAG: adenylyltransferase/cytidyltransferase family protein [Clostridia bacterium]|nr:adenylyltransferase/cytidyltransferase family protein [Clostridia bacterium]
MTKVITYGTFDLLHYGHIRLLERAKALGDYLIVGVTSDDYDKSRGKINNQQSLMERIAAIEETGLADEIIVEEYEGQKIDDIKRLDIDIFTIGSDWKGKFDYLGEFCNVVYLDRTEGVSSSEIRAESRKLKIKIIGQGSIVDKFIKECSFVNGIELSDNDYSAVYIATEPSTHYDLIKKFLNNGKHVICESPIAETKVHCDELFDLAEKNNLLLMDAIKTAYSTAYRRIVLLVKSGKIGDVVSVDATCTSMRDLENTSSLSGKWNSICAWGPTALLPIFQILGTDYKSKQIVSHFIDLEKKFDGFTKIDFIYERAVASVKVAKTAKSEGELIITGTKGYIYVPAPWWKTDYFEVRYERIEDNQKYFYQLDGEGIRSQIVSFVKSIEKKNKIDNISKNVSTCITKIIEDFNNNKIEI